MCFLLARIAGVMLGVVLACLAGPLVVWWLDRRLQREARNLAVGPGCCRVPADQVTVDPHRGTAHHPNHADALEVADAGYSDQRLTDVHGATDDGDKTLPLDGDATLPWQL